VAWDREKGYLEA